MIQALATPMWNIGNPMNQPLLRYYAAGSIPREIKG